MGKIKILNDDDGEYGYPAGTIVDIYDLFRDFRKSNDCDDSIYNYLCRIPIPAAVDIIAEKWGISYKYV